MFYLQSVQKNRGETDVGVAFMCASVYECLCVELGLGTQSTWKFLFSRISLFSLRHNQTPHKWRVKNVCMWVIICSLNDRSVSNGLFLLVYFPFHLLPSSANPQYNFTSLRQFHNVVNTRQPLCALHSARYVIWHLKNQTWENMQCHVLLGITEKVIDLHQLRREKESWHVCQLSFANVVYIFTIEIYGIQIPLL